MWNCPKCNERLEDAFETCWKCGTAITGAEVPEFHSDADPSGAQPDLSMHILCLPQGICSWNYFLKGQGCGAFLQLGWMGEQGAITIDDTRLEVCKPSFFGGRWTLLNNGVEVALAHKPNVFTRTIKVESSDGSLCLTAETAFGRSFRVIRSDILLATITPVHVFTRRAIIEIQPDTIDFSTISFCFWLVALAWRRQNNSN